MARENHPAYQATLASLMNPGQGLKDLFQKRQNGMYAIHIRGNKVTRSRFLEPD